MCTRVCLVCVFFCGYAWQRPAAKRGGHILNCVCVCVGRRYVAFTFHWFWGPRGTHTHTIFMCAYALFELHIFGCGHCGTMCWVINVRTKPLRTFFTGGGGGPCMCYCCYLFTCFRRAKAQADYIYRNAHKYWCYTYCDPFSSPLPQKCFHRAQIMSNYISVARVENFTDTDRMPALRVSRFNYVRAGAGDECQRLARASFDLWPKLLAAAERRLIELNLTMRKFSVENIILYSIRRLEMVSNSIGFVCLWTALCISLCNDRRKCVC